MTDSRAGSLAVPDVVPRLSETPGEIRWLGEGLGSANDDIYRGLRAGAKSYLLKDASRQELVEAIRAVYAGQTLIPPAVAAKLAQRMSQPELTSREVDVLKLMAQGKSNKEIGSALFISEGTVKSHVKSIFAKLNVISRTEAVANATRRGLIQL